MNRPSPGAASAWSLLAPALFVFLWSTGFVGAKLGLPHAEPFTFLALRMAIATALTALMAAVLRAPWPASAGEWGWTALAGILLQGVYLGGVFMAISRGMPAGVTALIVGMQPLLTAALAGPLLGDRVGARQWLGLVVGFAGIATVLAPGIAPAGIDGPGIAMCAAGLLGITLGTLVQKRHLRRMDLRSGAAIQFAVSGIAFAVLAYALETRIIHWTGEFVLALSWLVLALSLGAISLLFVLLRLGAAASVASLFYLTPPTTAIIAWALFDERLPPSAWGGMVLAALGVWLVTTRREPTATPSP